MIFLTKKEDNIETGFNPYCVTGIKEEGLSITIFICEEPLVHLNLADSTNPNDWEIIRKILNY